MLAITVGLAFTLKLRPTQLRLLINAISTVLHGRDLSGQLYGCDPDGDAITAQLVSGPSQGTLTLNADGSFTYTPNRHYVGPDSFTYTWSDGLNVSADPSAVFRLCKKAATTVVNACR